MGNLFYDEPKVDLRDLYNWTHKVLDPTLACETGDFCFDNGRRGPVTGNPQWTILTRGKIIHQYMGLTRVRVLTAQEYGVANG